MLIDMHVHTSRYSACGKSTPEEMLKRAEQVGLNALVFTEHHMIWPRHELAVLRAAFPRILIFSGVEIETMEGEDLLVYGVQDDFPCSRYLPATDVINLARQQGGYTTLAHPLRYRDTSEAVLDAAPDGIEVMSIHVLNYARRRIDHLAARYHLLPMAASDAHHTSALGYYAITLQEPASTLQAILSGLRSTRYRLFSDAERIRAGNNLAMQSKPEVQKRLEVGDDDGAIARQVSGYTAHMVHALRNNLDFLHPLS